VAKTAAGTFASKRHCIKRATRKDRLSTSIVTDLLAVFMMPKSKPTPTGPMRMQSLERGSIMPTQGLPGMPTAGKAAQTPQPKLQPTGGRSSPSRRGDNNAAKLPAETARRAKGQDAALVSGIDFPIQVVKVREPLHRQAVLVFFALDVHFHQMLEQPFTGTPGLGTVCKGTIYDQRAING
jgi:hypothetical protein